MVDLTKILIASLIIGAISTASYFYGKQSERTEILQQYNTEIQQKQVINDKLSNELIEIKQQDESKLNDLQNKTAKLNDNLSKCHISNGLLLKFQQATNSVQHPSELSSENGRIVADGESNSGLTAEDLSENYILASSKYVSCAKQYNQLLQFLGY